MNWKLFFTLVGAAIVSYLIIRWLRMLETPVLAFQNKRREMGFAAIAKQREELELQGA